MSKYLKRFLGAMLMTLMCFFSSAQAEITLKLNGVAVDSLGDFRTHNNNVILEEENYKYYSTTSELTSDLLIGAFDYDVFEMSNSRMDYRLIMEKGYCLDLSSSVVIQNAMQRLHPVFAQQCTMDGKIFAIPYAIQLNYIAISPSMLAKTGIEYVQIPSTFPEFLDFLELWILYLKDNPDCDVALLGMAHWGDASFYDADSYTTFLVDLLFENYMMQMEYAGKALAFNEEELLPLLNRCYQIGHELYLYDPGVQTKYSILQVVTNIALSDYEYLSLRLNSNQPKLMQVFVNLYAANSETQNPELCIELMEALCLNNSPMYNTYMFQDAEPLLDPQYYSRVARMQELIQDTQHELNQDSLDASYRAELEYRLERQENNLQNLMENESEKYLVTLEELDWFRSHVDFLFVQMPGAFSANDVKNANAFKQLKMRYVMGQITAKELISELNRMAWMIEMEAE